MKKLLLASLFMVGISAVASAQTPEAVREKKAAAKKEKNEPALTTAVQPASAKPTAETKSKGAVKEKTDAEVTKEVEVKKATHPNKSKQN